MVSLVTTLTLAIKITNGTIWTVASLVTKEMLIASQHGNKGKDSNGRNTGSLGDQGNHVNFSNQIVKYVQKSAWQCLLVLSDKFWLKSTVQFFTHVCSMGTIYSIGTEEWIGRYDKVCCRFAKAKKTERDKRR